MYLLLHRSISSESETSHLTRRAFSSITFIIVPSHTFLYSHTYLLPPPPPLPLTRSHLDHTEATLAEFKQKVALREKEFLLRDELLMDKVTRSQQSAYKTLDLANTMADRYYAAQDVIDASQEQVQIVHSRGALIISRLERERELFRSLEM